MRISKFDEYAGDVLHIGVRLAPIDVGFDLRAEGMVALVPADTSVASYERDGERLVVEGSAAEVLAELRGAGYDVHEE